jgi:hypothetical protein
MGADAVSEQHQGLVLRNIVSPYGLAIFSYGVFLFACAMPPSLYRAFMHEPDLMFLDAPTILFYTLCVLAFLAGVKCFEELFGAGPARMQKLETRFPGARVVLLPLAAGIALSVLSSLLLVTKNPTLLVMLTAQQGSELRGLDGSGLEFDGTLRSSVFFLIGILWWVFWRSGELELTRGERRWVKAGTWLALITVFVSSSLTISRQPFVVAISGVAILYVLRKVLAGQLTWGFIVKMTAVMVCAGTLFFFLVSWIRGGSLQDGQADALVGYTIASYNRLAALLDGRLHYEFAGKGIYLSNFLLFNNTFNRVVPIGKLMDIPDYFNWWASDFAAVAQAGLDGSMIYCGMFGDIFVELGWFTPLYVFGYGLLYGFTWKEMREGSLFGILMYPYFAHLITFWFGTNAVFETLTFALFADALLLAAYERFLRFEPRLQPAYSVT